MIKILKKLNKKDWLLVFICFILIVAQVWLDLKLPDFMSAITRLVQTEGSKMGDILIQGCYMLICAFGSLILAVGTGYFVSYISADLSKNVRESIYKKVSDFGIEEIKLFSTSSLITRTTNDITQVEMIVAMGLQILIKAPITAVWAIFKILNKGWQWSVVTGGVVVVLMTLIITLIIIVLPKFKIVQKLTDNLNNVTRENLTGIRVVRAFNAQKYQEEKFAEANTSLTKVQLFTQKSMSILGPTMHLSMSILTLAIYWIGAYLINEANMLDRITIFSNMVVFSSYAIQVIMSFMMMIMIFILLPRASVSAKRINEVLDSKIKIKDGNIHITKPKEVGTVEFKNVSFKYPDAEEYMLEDISFKVKKGEFVAFIGSTGSGKTTLINLIPRFYDVTDGEILIDGINVKEYKQEYLNNKLGYIPQKAVMFSGTIKDNVAYGKSNKKITDEQVKKAVEVAQGKEFVEAMEDEYDSHIAQGGTNISGGQKQRLAIARAIARDPEIYIFDDSFSALDYKTDYLLRKELRNYTKGATVLVVAQRIGTIKNADRIIVLDNGKMVGMGSHKELLKNCDVYKEIALSQLSKEELADE